MKLPPNNRVGSASEKPGLPRRGQTGRKKKACQSEEKRPKKELFEAFRLLMRGLSWQRDNAAHTTELGDWKTATIQKNHHGVLLTTDRRISTRKPMTEKKRSKRDASLRRNVPPLQKLGGLNDGDRRKARSAKKGGTGGRSLFPH